MAHERCGSCGARRRQSGDAASHNSLERLTGIALLRVEALATPLGPVAVDDEARRTVRDLPALAVNDPVGARTFHRAQLPFPLRASAGFHGAARARRRHRTRGRRPVGGRVDRPAVAATVAYATSQA